MPGTHRGNVPTRRIAPSSGRETLQHRAAVLDQPRSHHRWGLGRAYLENTAHDRARQALNATRIGHLGAPTAPTACRAAKFRSADSTKEPPPQSQPPRRPPHGRSRYGAHELRQRSTRDPRPSSPGPSVRRRHREAAIVRRAPSLSGGDARMPSSIGHPPARETAMACASQAHVISQPCPCCQSRARSCLRRTGGGGTPCRALTSQKHEAALRREPANWHCRTYSCPDQGW